MSGFNPDADAGTAASAKVAGELFEERVRQQIGEPWTIAHDDAGEDGDLAFAGACYAQEAGHQMRQGRGPNGHPAFVSWPWGQDAWKPGVARRALVKAGALIIAAIERLDRENAR